MPFLYEMVISFYGKARDSLQEILYAIDSFPTPAADAKSLPASPERVAEKFSQLPIDKAMKLIGMCLVSTTNLGLAYVHAFRILGMMDQKQDVLLRENPKLDIVDIYESLAEDTKELLGATYKRIDTYDYEIEIGTTSNFEKAIDEPLFVQDDFRATLEYWQSKQLMQESHLTPNGGSLDSVLRMLIPRRSLLVLDQILAEQIAPKVGQVHKTIGVTSSEENPVLEWDGETILVSLPMELGGAVAAKWSPKVTSVIRIRESNVADWSPGFEIPLNSCSFSGLKPDTDYDVQITHKNESGESESKIMSFRTDMKHKEKESR